MTDMEDDILIDYPTMIDEAMRGVVREALLQVQREGELPGEHHFFITFDTNFPGAEISSTLKKKYPNEMTIVLQHQFWDLEVTNEEFTVTLSFNKRPEKLIIPFAAMTAFADPSIKFGLQFHLVDDDFDFEDDDELPLMDGGDPGNDESPDKKGKDKRPVAEVISIDTFRK
jgi:hypothetical protein